MENTIFQGKWYFSRFVGTNDGHDEKNEELWELHMHVGA